MIVGAGMAGLIAGHLLPNHEICERDPPRNINPHAALLRFRSSIVSDATGIEFRQVTVHKGIWLDGKFQPPSIMIANMYAAKVIGRFSDRSIWNLADSQRWIAPPDFYERLIAGVGQRLHWGVSVNLGEHTDDVVISTVPLPATLRSVHIASKESFSWAPIYVLRFRVVGSDVHQTIYFPTTKHNLYRASLTGDLLTCEFVSDPATIGCVEDWISDVENSFFTSHKVWIEGNPEQSQEFGKITPIDEAERKHLIVSLTNNHGIYSLGRFATWRNIMLDDVVHDVSVVKRLIAASGYERKLYI